MPTVPYPRDTKAARRVYIGLAFDEYTPAVEAQILRDCQAMLSIADANEEVVVACESDKPDRTIEALGMRRVPTIQMAKVWILYRTGENFPETPDWATTEIHRDLYVAKKNPNILREVDEEESTGYYLPPQGRLSPDTLSLERPAPNGYVPTDTNLFFIWGP